MDLFVSRFRFDATPPLGHPLCGGWIKPVVGVDDSLEAIGVVLLGGGAPVVLCAVDWTGLCNQAHADWRAALAEAAHTTPEHVLVHCVHQHNAPFVCLEADRLVAEQNDLPKNVDLDFFRRTLDRGRDALRQSLQRTQRLTHVAVGQAKVEKVASNRRFVGPDGKIQHWRGSSSKDPLHHQLPEGRIDPWLKTIALYSGAKAIASMHFFATHPMSYYGDGRPSSDFVGLARKALERRDTERTRIYFTGCAGDIAAGKYNDGSPAARKTLTSRIEAAIVSSERGLQPRPISQLALRSDAVSPAGRTGFPIHDVRATISDRSRSVADRCRAAFQAAFLRRLEAKTPIPIARLDVGPASIVSLPAECFVEYQFAAQAIAPDRFIATAAYGDGGPWYIPTRHAYPQGGYEVSVAFCDPSIDDQLRLGLGRLFDKA